MKQSVGEKATNIVISLAAAFLIIIILKLIHYYIFPNYGFPTFPDHVVPLEFILHACILSPIIESFVWIYLPFSILKNTDLFKDNKYQIAILIGCLFGYSHGGFINILVQGVAGSAFGVVYIDNKMSYLSSVIAHSLYNVIVLILIPIIL